MTLDELVRESLNRHMNLGQLARVLEAEETGLSLEQIISRIGNMISVMKDAVRDGLSSTAKSSRSGLSGGDGLMVARRVSLGQAFPGNQLLARACSYALAVSEVNASMGRIVAAPTAGSCGVIPGTFLALAEAFENQRDDKMLLDALSAAGLIGQVIGEKASLSGAQAGCQAECGSAAAMAAAGLTQMGGGSPLDCIHAAAMALKGLMGLVCDPVAGLVEIPCIKRNATSAAVALASAEMALSGVRSRIPPDEVIAAMAQVGRAMPDTLRETAKGGLAVTPTGLSIACRLRVLDSDKKP